MREDEIHDLPGRDHPNRVFNSGEEEYDMQEAVGGHDDDAREDKTTVLLSCHRTHVVSWVEMDEDGSELWSVEPGGRGEVYREFEELEIVEDGECDL